MTAQRHDEKTPAEKTIDPEAETAQRPGSLSERETAATPVDAARRSGRAAFDAGQLVALRYEIVRFIARGGMGEVYEARDRKLQGTLALKTIRADMAGRATALDRFLREVQIARRVTHPNVCRIFDVDEHHWPIPEGAAQPRAPLTFLTMELLAGETLSDRLARGRPDPAEALDIVTQIAAGLDAAHALGIVHRDFKSGNVMLVPPVGGRGGTRVVITDFGLARAFGGDDPLASISETGAVVGTPAYMAPEQVEGKDLTPAADLYALGVVMYEMVTGRRPFTGSSAISVAAKRLQGPPPSPRTLVPDLDPAWAAAILRCLELDPGDRFASAADVVRAIGGQEVAAGTGSATSERRRSARRSRLAVGVVLGLVAVGGAALVLRSRASVSAPSAGVSTPGPAAPVPPRAPRKSLAILGVANTTGKPGLGWLATAIPEMLSTELGAGEGLRLVSGSEIGRVRKELGASEDVTGLSRETLAHLGRGLGAELLAVGSYTLVGGGQTPLVRVDLRVTDAASGEMIASAAATGTEAQVFDLVSRAGGALRQKLGLKDVSPTQSLQVEASLPANREAAQLYAEGIARLRAAEPVAAREALERAVAADPKHPLPHAALAEAWSALGYEGKARTEAKLAAAAGAALPPDQKLLIDARYHEAEKDWPKAIESYKSLVGQVPDSPDYGLRLAEAEIFGGRPKETLVTLDGLRKLAAAAQDPRLDIVEARAQKALGNNQASRDAAARGAAAAAAQGMRVLEARARARESVALLDLGQPGPAMAAAEKARDLAEAAGDQDWTARALEQMALTIEPGGDLDGAQRLYDRALKIYRSIGDESSVARALRGMARLCQKQGRPRESADLYEQALATFRRIGARHEMGPMLNNLGAKLQIEGDLAGAQNRYREALAIFGEVGDKRNFALTLTNLGEVLFARGDLKQSQDMHQESLATNREIGDKAGQGYDLYRLAEVSSARGDLKTARDKYAEALALLEQAGDRLTAGEARLGLARLDLAQGNATAAEGRARESEEVFRSEGSDRQALSLVVLADALLAQKKTADAKIAAESARVLAEKSNERRARWGSARVAALARAASGAAGDQAAAITSLETLAAEPARTGYFSEGLELRMAAGEVESQAGRSSAARARLQAVAREATAKGFGLLARRASTLAGK